jgi:hypothetical protein
MRTIRNSDSSYKVITDDGTTVGFVHVWYDRQALNSTGEKRFRAAPLGCDTHGDFATLDAAIAYIGRVFATA